jgi:metal-sulfur cluster biosynthetic enzyme
MDMAGCSLAELIDDPLINLLMKSDGVDRREVELLLEWAARTASASVPICGTPVNHRNNKPAVDPR